MAAAQRAEYTKFRFIGELQKRLLFRTYKNVQMMVYVPKVPAEGKGVGTLLSNATSPMGTAFLIWNKSRYHTSSSSFHW